MNFLRDEARNISKRFNIATVVIGGTAGFVVMGVSGYIEYFGMSTILPPDQIPWYLTGFIVAGIETTKVLPTVLRYMYPESRALRDYYTTFVFIRTLAVMVSIWFSILFIGAANSGPEMDSYIDSQIELIDDQKSEELKIIDDDFDNVLEALTADLRIERDSVLIEIPREKLNTRSDGTFDGPRLDALQLRLDEIDSSLLAIRTNSEKDRRAAKNEVLLNFRNRVAQVELNAKNVLNGGNRFLIAFLELVIVKREVTESDYVWLIVLLSIITAFVFELIIRVTFNTLAILADEE